MHCELLLGGQTWWEDMHVQNYENSKACKKMKKTLESTVHSEIYA